MKAALSIAIIGNFKDKKILQLNCRKNNKFQAASISKPLTALLVVKLAEEKKLDLNKDVNLYLKDYKVVDKKGKETKVTLKQILSHTAGLNVSGFPGYAANKKIPSIDQILNGTKPCNTEKIFVKYNPGKKYAYSGGGYIVLQKIIEEVTKKKFEKIMKEKIFKPLKMNNSDYKIRKSKKFKIYPEKAAAGLWTTTEDLSKFLIEIQLSYVGKSNKILKKKTIKQILTPIINAEWNYMGVGFFISKNKKNFYHSGHNYKHRGFLKGSLKKGNGLIIMANFNNQKKMKSLVKKYSKNQKGVN